MNLNAFDSYVLLNADGIGARKVNRIIRWEEGSSFEFEQFRRLGAGKMQAAFPFLTERDVMALKNIDVDELREEYEGLVESGIEMIMIGSSLYPVRLRDRLDLDSPPLLFCYGNTVIFNTAGLAIVGSRHASVKAIEFAGKIVGRFSDHEIPVISGGAYGIDTAAHRAAVDCGLSTVIVLAEGIEGFLKRQAADFPIENAVVVSQFLPRSPWNAGFAMARNRVVCALSDSVIVVEAGEKGGSLHAGRTALELGIPLYVVDPGEFESRPPGNAILIAAGGKPICLKDL